jgi:catechol 2,3-dioxygenase-like lactoylglutathione lyase family enzyme
VKGIIVSNWPGEIFALTLFVDDLEATKRFYQEVFDAPLVHEDETSAAFKFPNTIVNLLLATEAPELIGPAAVAPASSGARLQITIQVDDVDATCAELIRRGVTLLNGPIDRPWGPRTAAFMDPGGHVWEIAS